MVAEKANFFRNGLQRVKSGCYSQGSQRREVFGMRLHVWTAAAALFIFCQGADCAATLDHPQPTYDDLKAAAHPMPFFVMHGGVDQQTVDSIKQGVRKNFDPRCLSSAKTHIVLNTLYCDDNGSPVFKKIIGENDTVADDFYCEQAVWEYIMAPGSVYRTDVSYEFNTDTKLEYGQDPELLQADSKKFVTLHLIPQHFAASDMTLNPNASDGIDVHSEKNVLRLPVDRISDPRLTSFRLEMLKIPSAPRSKVRQYAEEVKAKYAGLFGE